MTTLEEAIKYLKYNEVLVANVPVNESEEREVVLVAAIDEGGNGISWQDASLKANSISFLSTDVVPKVRDVGILCHLRTKKWILPMLNDTHRNDLYASSIKKACETVVQRIVTQRTNRSCSRESIHVLDIGSGTGLLAMITARNLNNLVRGVLADDKDKINVKVISVEMASAMARLARATIESNNLSNYITVVEGHSCDPNIKLFESTSDLECVASKHSKAVLCISELLESGLLGEGIIPAIRDAWERHLTADAIIVPQRARVYAQILEGKHSVAQFRGPTVESNNVRLCIDSESKRVLCGGKGIDGGILVPIHAEALFQDINEIAEGFFLGRGPSDIDNIEKVKPLTDPALVLEFDFTSKDSLPSPDKRIFKENIVTPIATGVAHAVLFWWELDILEGVTYSTEVGKSPWQDHWQQCIFVFGEDHDDLQVIEKGVPCMLVSSHNDTSIGFKIKKIELDFKDNDNTINTSANKRQRISSMYQDQKINNCQNNDCKTHYISPERALQLNDQSRMKALYSAIQYALGVKGSNATVLDIGDFSLCALIAAVSCGATVVNSVESSSGDAPMLSAMISQLGNNLPRKIISNGKETDKEADYQIIQAHLENLSTDHLLGGQADLVMAEPYFEVLEGWHLLESLNYYYIIKAMKKKGVIANDALTVPSSAKIVGCAVEFLHLNKAHRGLAVDDSSCENSSSSSKTVCGFDHEEVEFYGNKYHQRANSFAIWQYYWKQLTPSFVIATIQYEGDAQSMAISGNEKEATTHFINSGTCHGLIYWVDYCMRVGIDDSDFLTMTTGNRNHHQALQMLKTPVVVANVNMQDAKFSVKPKFGNCSGLETHTFEVKLDRKSVV